MGFRISGPHVVAFLEWVRQRFPDVSSFDELSETSREDAIRQFSSQLPRTFSRHDFEWELKRLASGGFQRFDDDGYSAIPRRSLFEAVLPRPTVRDGIELFRSARACGIFLYTEQDTNLIRYLEDYWRALDAEAGPDFHFFDFGFRDLRRPQRSYTFAEDYIRALSPIPGASLEIIRAAGLPCLLIWSPEGQSTIVPLADAQDRFDELRDRFRFVFECVRRSAIGELEAVFADPIRRNLREKADVFLSYQHADRGRADDISEAISSNNKVVWYDPHIRAGERWDLKIRHMLGHAAAVVVLWTQNSAKSHFVQAEADLALQSKKLIPVLVELPISLPVPFNTIQSVDLTAWRRGEPLPPALVEAIEAQLSRRRSLR